MAADYLPVIGRRLGFWTVRSWRNSETVEFCHRGFGFLQAAAALQQFGKNQIRLRVAGLARNGLLLHRACFREPVAAGQDNDQKIKSISFPDIDPAGTPQKLNRAINLARFTV